MSTVNEKITEKIRSEAQRLLSSGEIAAFIGYEAGSLPMSVRPFVARKPEDASRLVWNSFCVLNLANYLPALLKSFEPPRRPGDPPPEGPLPKVGILATGCWSRNIVVQIKENQVDRDRVVIVGVPSRGMVSARKVKEAVGERDIQACTEEDHSLKISGEGFEQELNRWDVVRDNCKTCVHPDPVIYDILIGDPAGERQVQDRFAQVDEIEHKSLEERWNWFADSFSSCVRCYACRNACPLCYCPTCFVDDSRPQWVGKSTEQTDTMLFHILRAYHCAGRCTDCGSCESVCPVGIPMRLLTKKLNKDVLEMYGSEAGMSLDEPLPLTTYNPADPQGFVLTEKSEKGGDR